MKKATKQRCSRHASFAKKIQSDLRSKPVLKRFQENAKSTVESVHTSIDDFSILDVKGSTFTISSSTLAQAKKQKNTKKKSKEDNGSRKKDRQPRRHHKKAEAEKKREGHWIVSRESNELLENQFLRHQNLRRIQV